MWYEQESPLPNGQQPLLPNYMRTMAGGHTVEISGGFAATPASAPGRSQVSSPCGLMGGTLEGTMNAIKRLQSEGYDFSNLNEAEARRKGYGRDSRSSDFKDVLSTKWVQGSLVEVGFGINANHGGVYSYRLCRRSDNLLDLTEECFQAGILPFHGSQQWYQFGANSSHRRPLTAQRWKDPSSGAQWTRLPIPSCSNHDGQSCDGPMFDPPYGIYGYGGDGIMDGFQVNVVDKLQLPADVLPGDYVLSFRYDVEDGGQVWLQCANVNVVPTSEEPVSVEQAPLPQTIQQLTKFRKGGPMSQKHCQAWCAADDNCLALEMSGCQGGSCRGSCYHFYTLDFENAVSHNDPNYIALGDDKALFTRFIKNGDNVFVSAGSALTPTQGGEAPATSSTTSSLQNAFASCMIMLFCLYW
jgi:hypothetical protein